MFWLYRHLKWNMILRLHWYLFYLLRIRSDIRRIHILSCTTSLRSLYFNHSNSQMDYGLSQLLASDEFQIMLKNLTTREVSKLSHELFHFITSDEFEIMFKNLKTSVVSKLPFSHPNYYLFSFSKRFINSDEFKTFIVELKTIFQMLDHEYTTNREVIY